MILHQLHDISVVPFSAIVSAYLFRLILTCDGVHFSLISHLSSCKTFTSFKHALTYSLPAVDPPVNAISSFWFSTPNNIVHPVVPHLTSL